MKALVSSLLFSIFTINSLAQEMIWAHEYFYVDNETMPTHIDVSHAEKIAVAGNYNSYSQSAQGTYLAMLDEHGQLMWGDTISGVPVLYKEISVGGLQFTASGELLLAINYHDSVKVDGVWYAGNEMNSLFLRYDANGKKLHVENFPDVSINDIHVDAAGKIYILSSIRSLVTIYNLPFAPKGKSDVLVVIMNPSGTPLGAMQVNGNAEGLSLKTTKNKDIVLYLSWSDSLHYDSHDFDWSHKEGVDACILRIDSAGKFISFKNTFTSMFQYGVDMDVLDNDNVVVSGETSYKGTWSYIQVYDGLGGLVGEDQYSGRGDYGGANYTKGLAAYKNNCWSLHFEYNPINYGLENDDIVNYELRKVGPTASQLMLDTFLVRGNGTYNGNVAVDSDGDIYICGKAGIGDSILIGNKLVINSDEYGKHSTFFVAKFADKTNTLGIGENDDKPVGTFYPNPTSGLLYIQQPFEGSHFVLRDVRGRSVLRSTPENGVVDLSALPRGVYFAELYDKQHRSVQKIMLR
jgi:hypothetical protein